MGFAKAAKLMSESGWCGAYLSVREPGTIAAGESFTAQNLWVKRPGTGEIKAVDYESLLGRRATRDLAADVQVAWADVAGV